MEYKTIKMDNASIEGRTIIGYAAAFGNIDHGRDIIKAGAFKKTISERQGAIKVFYNHVQPIGLPTAMAEDSKGLLTESKISKTAKGDEILELAKDGVLSEMSIAYDVIDHETDQHNGIRTLKELKLWEYGPVDFAMNEQAAITGVKSLAENLGKHKPINKETLDAVRHEVKQLLAALDRMEPGPSHDTLADDGPSIDTRVCDLSSEISGRLAEAFGI